MASPRNGERGSEIVELAIVLPVLMLLVLIVVEGALMVRSQQVVTNAAREAARLAVLKENQCFLPSPPNLACASPAPPSQTAPTPVQNVAADYITRNGVTCSALTPASISPTTIPKAGGGVMTATRVQITCNYQLRLLPKFIFFGRIPSQFPLKTTVVWRNLY
jgi:TadE-like protein